MGGSSKSDFFCVVAGDTAQVALASRDVFLNPIQSGGACITAVLRTFAAGQAEPAVAPAAVHDRGDGTYSIDCSLTLACNFEVC